MKSDKPVESKYNRTCVYAGRKLSYDENKVFQRFIKEDGEEMIFQGVKGVWIGYTYRCSDNRIAAKPERVHEIERIDNAEWEATDALVDARNAKRRAESKLSASSKPTIKAAIAALRPLMKGRSYFDRRALIEWLCVEASKK